MCEPFLLVVHSAADTNELNAGKCSIGQQSFSFFRVGGIGALGEPVVDFGEHRRPSSQLPWLASSYCDPGCSASANRYCHIEETCVH